MDQLDLNPASEASLASYVPAPVARDEHAEGPLTRLLEQQAAKVASDVFLFTALGAMGASLVLEALGQTRWSRFVGMWPAPLLVMGVYNKLVKTLRPR